MTTEGTAASMSISVPTGARTAGGASSLRNRPIAIEIGPDRSIAPNDVTVQDEVVERQCRAARTACVDGVLVGRARLELHPRRTRDEDGLAEPDGHVNGVSGRVGPVGVGR